MWNAISLVQDLNSCRRVHFLPLHHGHLSFALFYFHLLTILKILCMLKFLRDSKVFSHRSLIKMNKINVKSHLVQLIGRERSPMVRKTRVQPQVESYQRLKKWYSIIPCLTLSIIRYISRVKSSNPGEEVVPSPTPWCSSYRKGSLRVTLDYGRQLYLYYIINLQIRN